MDVLALELGNGDLCYIDADVYERALTVGFTSGRTWTGRPCDYSWQPAKRQHTTYARINLRRDGKGIEVLLHRLIAQAVGGQYVDHRDGNGLNNVSSNIRICTNGQNQINKQHKLHSSRFRGVSRAPTISERWIAQIKNGDRVIRLGTFADEISAARRYDEAAVVHHGSFARLNFPASE